MRPPSSVGEVMDQEMRELQERTRNGGDLGLRGEEAALSEMMAKRASVEERRRRTENRP